MRGTVEHLKDGKQGDSLGSQPGKLGFYGLNGPADLVSIRVMTWGRPSPGGGGTAVPCGSPRIWHGSGTSALRQVSQSRRDPGTPIPDPKSVETVNEWAAVLRPFSHSGSSSALIHSL